VRIIHRAACTGHSLRGGLRERLFAMRRTAQTRILFLRLMRHRPNFFNEYSSLERF
jgi:hypothetical protein